MQEHLFTTHLTIYKQILRRVRMRTLWLVGIAYPNDFTKTKYNIASIPFTFRVGTPIEQSFENVLSMIARRSQLAVRDTGSSGFTGNHKLVIVLVILALMTAVTLIAYSMRQAKRQEKEARERGAFMRGLQAGDVGLVKVGS